MIRITARRGRVLGVLAAATMLAGVPVASGEAGERTTVMAFAINAGSLQQALVAYASATGIQLLYASDVVAGKTAPRVIGDFTPETALTNLLAGSRLAARRVAPRVFVIEATPGARKVAARLDSGDGQAQPGRLDGPGETSAVAVAGRDVGSEMTLPQDQTDAPTEIVVTGTHIRGLTSGAPPVTRIDRDDLTRNGYATVAQALQSLPGNFAGTASEQSALSFADTTGSNATLATGVNLRGLGAGATLVLINGQRLGGSGTEGAFSDVSMLPTGALDRVEVLLDGASAIYGSDAVGGVVNILLRRHFQGAETQVRFGAPTRGSKRDIQLGQTLGTRWSTGGVMLAYEYARSGRLASADRRFARTSDLRALGGTDHRLIFSVPGNVLGINPATGGLAPAFAIPAGQAGTGLSPSDFQAGVVNLRNNREGSDLIPRQERHSLYASADQELGDTVTLSADLRYSRRRFDARLPAAAAVVPITAANPYFVSPTGAAFDLIAYALGREVGPIGNHGRAEAIAASAGIDADLGADWKVRGYGAFAQERNRGISDNLANVAAIAEAVGTTPDDPTTSFSTARDGFFNPYGNGAANSPAILAFIGNGFNRSDTKSRIWTGHIDADGSLFEVPGGAIKLAIGADVRRETFGALGVGRSGGAGERELFDVGGGRTVLAGFAELRAPIVGPGNESPLIRRLDFVAAGRVEHYPRFGTTANPKLGLVWEPAQGFAVRTSWGTSFRAPNLRQLGDAQQYSATTLTGPGGASLPVIQLSGGNPDLKPEKARSWTAGIDLAPAAAPGLSVHVTWFSTVFRQRIATPAAENFGGALLDPALAPFVERLAPLANPADLQRIRALLADPAFSGDNPFPVASFGAVVDTRYVNTGRLIVDGIDLTVAQVIEAGRNRFDLSVSGTWLAHYRERITPTADPVDRLNLVGRPVDLKGRATAGWTRGIANAQVAINHVGSYRDLSGGPINAWTTMDLQIGIDLPQRSYRALGGTSLSLAVSNLFNTAPPFYDSPLGLGYDAANADGLGRFVSLQLTRRW